MSELDHDIAAPGLTGDDGPIETHASQLDQHCRDLGGNGRTAVKVSLGRYNPPLRSTTTNPPAAGITESTNRTWNDTTFGAGDPPEKIFSTGRVRGCNVHADR